MAERDGDSLSMAARQSSDLGVSLRLRPIRGRLTARPPEYEELPARATRVHRDAAFGSIRLLGVRPRRDVVAEHVDATRARHAGLTADTRFASSP